MYISELLYENSPLERGSLFSHNKRAPIFGALLFKLTLGSIEYFIGFRLYKKDQTFANHCPCRLQYSRAITLDAVTLNVASGASPGFRYLR